MLRMAGVPILLSLVVTATPAEAGFTWLSDYFEATLNATITATGSNTSVMAFGQIPTTAGRFIRFKRVSCRVVPPTGNPPFELWLVSSSTNTGTGFRRYFVSSTQFVPGLLAVVVNADVDYLISTGTFLQLNFVTPTLTGSYAAECVVTGIPVP